MDIFCSFCGEPWDAYGVRHHIDMDEEEARRFNKGEGCPCCGFGSKCSSCDGTGIDEVIGCNCSHGRVLARKGMRDSDGYQGGVWYYFGAKTMAPVPVTERSIEVIRHFMNNFAGMVYEAWFKCPKCSADPTKIVKCERCKGTGKLKKDEQMVFDAMLSACEASDEDPIKIMEERGF